MSEILKPPVYCPTAIATDAGWVNPRSGELLMAIRNLKQRITESELAKAYQASLPEPVSEVPIQKEEIVIIDDGISDVTKTIQTANESTPILGKTHTLAIIDDIGLDDAVKKPKQRGRPKKVKDVESK